MDKHALEFGLLSFVSLFTMVNPLGVIPVYVTMTSELDAGQSRKVALKASIFALVLLFSFALIGRFVFDFFNISIPSLRIVGGIIFFIIGYEMLQARLTRTKFDRSEPAEYAEDIAITPLGIPMLCGPGAITSVILLMNETQTMSSKVALLVAILLVMGITHMFLLSAQRLTKIMGESAKKVMMRVMGLIVMMIAIEFFFNGLKPILQEILAAN